MTYNVLGDVRRDEALHKLVLDYLSDDEYAAMQQFLVVNPEAGDVIPASGGVRNFGGASA